MEGAGAGCSDHRGCLPLHLHRLGGGLLACCRLLLLLGGESLEELDASGLEVERLGLHPGVGADLLNGGSLVALIAEELEDEVLEVLAESLSVHLLEVDIGLALEEQVVEVFLLSCLLEWEDALDNDEDDNSNGEHVDLLSLVGLVFLDFWGHVGHCSSVAGKVVNALVASETEISNLEVEVVGDEDVLELEVSVDDLLVVHVLHGVNDLVEEEASGVLSHGSHGLAEVKE